MRTASWVDPDGMTFVDVNGTDWSNDHLADVLDAFAPKWDRQPESMRRYLEEHMGVHVRFEGEARKVGGDADAVELTFTLQPSR